jgi:flagellar transcriptional activator FlhD
VKTDQMLQAIRETNMTYLILAQNMIRADKPQAMYRLGISEEVATILEQLSTGQVLKIASSNMLVCTFRFENQMVWDLLTSNSKDRGVAGVHAAILTAGAMNQAAQSA